MNELAWVNFSQKTGQVVVLQNSLLSTEVEVLTFGDDGIGWLKLAGPKNGLIYARVDGTYGQKIYGVIYNLTSYGRQTWVFKPTKWPAICHAT